ncbi:MAG: DUF2975 domain-containing protein [Oscillospiraceae bacterium]|nr:DUF2975 domain-containing protein [Oscillospiraceae bacterium]
MSSKTLCVLVRAAVVTVAICGILVCCWVLPSVGKNFTISDPEYAHAYVPWLFFLWAASLPCFAILGLVWKASIAIKQDRVFTLRTARLVKYGSVLLFCDVGFFFAGNLVFMGLGLSHPGVLLASLFADVFGISLAMLAAVLARYITKAAVLQEEADGTI